MTCLPQITKAPLSLLQALRGLAALLVMLSHGSFVLGPLESHPILRAFLESGAIGVDLFFMISGFIMIYSTWGASTTWVDAGTFLIKRLCRIWPVYAIWTLVWVVAREGSLSAGPTIDIVKSLVFLPLSIDYPPFYGYAALNVGWTLNYEILFYVLFAISMLFGRGRWAALAVIFTFLLIVAPILAQVLPTLRPYRIPIFSSALIDMIANPIIAEFGFGVIAGWIYFRPKSRLPFMLSLGVMALFTSIVIWQMASHFRYGHGFSGWGLTLAPLFIATVYIQKEVRPEIVRWLVWLGDVSFSLYLCHKIVFALCARVVARTGTDAFVPGWIFLLIYAGIALLVAYVSTRALEKGLCEVLRRKVLQRVEVIRTVRTCPLNPGQRTF